MELHTLGVGSGYTQDDVQELARILTGMGINRSGQPAKLQPAMAHYYRGKDMFEFNPNRHDLKCRGFCSALQGRRAIPFQSTCQTAKP